jgi:hypothetical protein
MIRTWITTLGVGVYPHPYSLVHIYIGIEQSYNDKTLRLIH